MFKLTVQQSREAANRLEMKKLVAILQKPLWQAQRCTCIMLGMFPGSRQEKLMDELQASQRLLS